MTLDLALLASAFVLGFAGSLHCVGMCGGIAAALAQSSSSRDGSGSFVHSFVHSLGRIMSYATLGGLFGMVGGAVGSVVGGAANGIVAARPLAEFVLRVLVGLLIVAIGFELARTGRAFPAVERGGQAIWRRVLPLARRVGRPDRPTAALALGALWGLLPCGLVYSGLVLAAASGDLVDGSAAMAAFGLGTLPAVVATAVFSAGLARLGSVARVRRGAGGLLVAFGLWSIAGAWVASHGHAAHAEHGAHPARDSYSAHDAHSAHDSHSAHP